LRQANARASPGAQPGVRQDGHERGVAGAELKADSLDGFGSERSHGSRDLPRLAHRLDRIARDVAVQHRQPHDALEHEHRLPDGRITDAALAELGSEVRNDFGR
jgi:hypothetical protein